MTQPIWYVDAHIVRSLVLAFAETGLHTCSGYNPVALDDDLQSLRDCDGRIPYNEVSNVLSRHNCDSLTAGCNRWTTWMRHKLREMKYTLDKVKTA